MSILRPVHPSPRTWALLNANLIDGDPGGYAGHGGLVIEDGRVVDGLGGTSGPAGWQGGGAWDGVSNLDLNIVGYVIVGVFVLTWGISMAVWRYGRIEERWSARLARGSAARP